MICGDSREMEMKVRTTIFLMMLAACLSGGVCARDLSYNRDIRPILSDNCFYCHGPDANHRKAKLRLDIREDALKSEAFVPGKADESELVKRIFTTDEDDRMPPVDSAKKLTEEQKATLKEWVAQGAKYEKHWAYIAPSKPEVQGNGIDFLVRKQLKTQISEPERRKSLGRVLKQLQASAEGHSASHERQVRQLLGLLERHDASRAEVDAKLAEMDGLNVFARQTLLDLRYELRAGVSAAEWTALFPPPEPK